MKLLMHHDEQMCCFHGAFLCKCPPVTTIMLATAATKVAEGAGLLHLDAQMDIFCDTSMGLGQVNRLNQI